MIKSKLARPFIIFRKFLERIRRANPQVIDVIYALVPFAITVFGTLFPGLFVSTWGFRICLIIVSAVIYIWQWAILRNDMYRRLDEEKGKRIKEIEDEFVVMNELDVDNRKELEAIMKEGVDGIQIVQNFSLNYSTFSHKVSHSVKCLCVEFETDFSVISIREMLANFLKPAINSFEDILSECYRDNIRASIKLSIDNKYFKTYVRGTNNIKSRGRYKSRRQDEKKLRIDNNYAYNAIVNKKLRFFSEGALPTLHNKFNDDDTFYCEHKDYLSIFTATVVMPIRIPKFDNNETLQQVIGLVCIDSKNNVPEWSSESIEEKMGYHIIANFSDSIALLIQAYINRMNAPRV